MDKKCGYFEKDFIVIPINDCNHWSLSVIVRPAVAMQKDFDKLRIVKISIYRVFYI